MTLKKFSVLARIVVTATTFFACGMVPGAELELGNVYTGMGISGFGVMVEHDDGNVGVIELERTTQPGANTAIPNIFSRWGSLCSLRIYAPDGKLFKYVELGDQSESNKVYQIEVGNQKPGVWRFSVSGGFSSDKFRIRFKESGVWAIQGEKILSVTETFPEKMWLWVAKGSERFIMRGIGYQAFADDVTKLDENVTPGLFMGTQTESTIPKGTGLIAVTRSEKPSPIAVLGVPGWFAPSANAAMKLRGGIVEVDGIEFAGPLQAQIYRHMQKYRPEDFNIPESTLDVPLSRHSTTTLRHQVLDKTDVSYGSIVDDDNIWLKPRQKNDYVKTVFGTGYNSITLSRLATIETQNWSKPLFKHPGMVNRAVLNAFETLSKTSSMGILDAMWTGGKGRIDTGMAFDLTYSICTSYKYLKPYLTSEQDELFRAAICNLTDKAMGMMSFQSNQWMHILSGLCNVYLATGKKRYKRAFEKQMHIFLDNAMKIKFGQHADGYFVEQYGPDGNYDNVSGFPLTMMYYTYGRTKNADKQLVAKMRAGIERNMMFKSFFSLRRPDHKERPKGGRAFSLAYANNHRTWGCLIGDGYPSIHMATKQFDIAYSMANSCNETPVLPPERRDWLDQYNVWPTIPHTSKAVTLPIDEKQRVWNLEGHTVWKHESGFYGMSFFKVYDNLPDGMMGPVFLYHDKIGLILASLRNKRDDFMVAEQDAEATWCGVFGTLNGSPFNSELRSGEIVTFKEREWIESAENKSGPRKSKKKGVKPVSRDKPVSREKPVPQEKYQIVGKVMRRVGNEKEEIGTVKWAYDLSGSGTVAMCVTTDVEGLENAEVVLPFFKDGGSNHGEIVSDGLFRFTTPLGSVDMQYPKGTQVRIVENTDADVFTLRLRIPSSNKLSFRFTCL